MCVCVCVYACVFWFCVRVCVCMCVCVSANRPTVRRTVVSATTPFTQRSRGVDKLSTSSTNPEMILPGAESDLSKTRSVHPCFRPCVRACVPVSWGVHRAARMLMCGYFYSRSRVYMFSLSMSVAVNHDANCLF